MTRIAMRDPLESVIMMLSTLKMYAKTVAVEVDAGTASLNRTDSNSFNLGVEDYLLQ